MGKHAFEKYGVSLYRLGLGLDVSPTTDVNRCSLSFYKVKMSTFYKGFFLNRN